MTIKEAYDKGFRDCLVNRFVAAGFTPDEFEKYLVNLEAKYGYDPPKEEDGDDPKKQS